MAKASAKKRICFVTGTRAEFGLMRSALDAIAAHPRLELQLVATGMHLDPAHGGGIAEIGATHRVDATVPWPVGSGKNPATNAANTGRAVAGLAEAFERLQSDVVLVVGDRTEAFAAAAAAHVSHRLLAHVHGGDRALGQIDDSLRHAITKLAHVHFPATKRSAARIRKLGEDSYRIFPVGSPGLDGIHEAAAPADEVAARFPSLRPGRYALVLLHPADADDRSDGAKARRVIEAVRKTGFDGVLAIYPNNDPGCRGIIGALESANDLLRVRGLPRATFLGLLRDAAALVGNSSSGIIEAASFHTPVLDIGPRQEGRERSGNVTHCGYGAAELQEHLARIWNGGKPRRRRVANVYGGGGAGKRMADILADCEAGLLRKLIRY